MEVREFLNNRLDLTEKQQDEFVEVILRFFEEKSEGLKTHLIQTKHNLERLHFDKKIDDEAFNILMERNFDALEKLKNL